MGLASRVMEEVCNNKHQIPLILKLLIVMAVFLGFTIFVQGFAALERPIVILNVVIIGSSIVLLSAALRYCAE